MIADSPPIDPAEGNPDWPGWRGANRDGVLPWLPSRLPVAVAPLWKARLPSAGHGGVAVADGVAVVGARDPADRQDLFDGFDAETGERVWRHTYPAPGSLDYGNSPRATPVIHDGVAYLQGALGHLTAVDLLTGGVLWERDLAADYETPSLEWGIAGTPLLIGDLLVVQPGGRKACVVGLDAATGEERWKSTGGAPSHSSLMHWKSGGHEWIVGLDAKGLSAWAPQSGRTVWSIVPELTGDFNVPTPLIVGERLFIATENNGARLYSFTDGAPVPLTPSQHMEEFAPDTHTPVAVGNRIYGIHQGLHAFEVKGSDLKSVWSHPDRRLNDYAFLVASGKRLLALTQSGELILWEDTGKGVRELGQLGLTSEDTKTLSAPAFVGTRCYVRVGPELLALELSEK